MTTIKATKTNIGPLGQTESDEHIMGAVNQPGLSRNLPFWSRLFRHASPLTFLSQQRYEVSPLSWFMASIAGSTGIWRQKWHSPFYFCSYFHPVDGCDWKLRSVAGLKHHVNDFGGNADVVATWTTKQSTASSTVYGCTKMSVPYTPLWLGLPAPLLHYKWEELCIVSAIAALKRIFLSPGFPFKSLT
jgi:hypothetical protein